ncbi:MAG: hypothetical protein JXO44_13345, partial [Clostridia bacterium]|nr:hypothetical protein [Clostridia bacterium]
ALFAEQEGEAEAEPESADPNKALSADEIAALFADQESESEEFAAEESELEEEPEGHINISEAIEEMAETIETAADQLETPTSDDSGLSDEEIAALFNDANTEEESKEPGGSHATLSQNEINDILSEDVGDDTVVGRDMEVVFDGELAIGGETESSEDADGLGELDLDDLFGQEESEEQEVTSELDLEEEVEEVAEPDKKKGKAKKEKKKKSKKKKEEKVKAEKEGEDNGGKKKIAIVAASVVLLGALGAGGFVLKGYLDSKTPELALEGFSIESLESEIVPKTQIKSIFRRLGLEKTPLTEEVAKAILSQYEHELELEAKVDDLEVQLDVANQEVEDAKTEILRKEIIDEDKLKQIDLSKTIVNQADGLSVLERVDGFLSNKLTSTYNVFKNDYSNTFGKGTFVEIKKGNVNVVSMQATDQGHVSLIFHSKIYAYSEPLNYFAKAYFDDEANAEEFISKMQYLLGNQEAKVTDEWEGVIEDKLITAVITPYRVYIEYDTLFDKTLVSENQSE